MSGVVPRSFRSTKPAPVKCQATVEDYENGRYYNIARPFVAPKDKQCSRNARSKLGQFCFCALHTRLALEGLIDEAGHVATRSVLRDVRKYPKKFPNGIYHWARSLKAEELK